MQQVGKVAVTSIAMLLGAVVAQQPARGDAKSDLEQKQKLREEQRSAPATITVGELEDLRSDLARTKAENATFKRANGGAAGPAVAAAAAKPVRRTQIEVGMTRDELILFVKQHKTEYELGDFSTKAGGVQSDTEQVITRTKASRGEDLTKGNTNNLTGTTGENRTLSTDVASDSASDTTTERRRLKQKREHVVVNLLGTKRAVVGKERNVAGTTPVYGRVKATVGKMEVDLVDDVVTEVNRDMFRN